MRRFLQDAKQWVTFAVAFAASLHARAQQRARVEEPQWVKLQVTEVSSGVYAEGRFEETSFNNSSTSVTHDRYFLGPLLGVNANGSVYHPNLFRFIINAEGAAGYAEDTVKARTSVHRQELEYLGRGAGSADIFANKPLHGTIYGDYDHTFRDYDFFSRAIVDSSRYGAKVAYDAGPVTLNAGYMHREEQLDSFNGISTTDQDVFTFIAHNERQRGSTSFNYVFDRYSRTDFGHAADGTTHTVSVADNERFGSRDQMRLNSSASYTRRDDFELSDDIFAAANLGVEHRYNLSSFYDLNYDRFTSDDFTASSYVGRGELRHQLYESLTSSLILQGADYETSDRRGSGYTRRFGGGFAEGYTKRIGSDHRIRVSNSFIVEHVDQQAINTVRNERHTFSEGGAPPGAFFLNAPNVKEGTIVVTDETDNPLAYRRGIDYDVVLNGDRTLITRIGGSRIPAGAVVLVDYEAEPTGAGAYEALTDTFQIRLDLWNNLWGVYNRVSLSLNNADRDLRVQNLVSYAVGTDVSWRFLRTGAEYEAYDSDLSKYQSLRFFESFTFNLDESSRLSLDFSQGFVDYIDADRQEENYRFITRFHHAFSSQLRVDLEGGVDLRRGSGFDQTLATARPGLEYVIGKTTIKAGYDFEYDLYLENEERTKHLFFVRARRVF